jgi:dipeptide/tripeptide permease
MINSIGNLGGFFGPTLMGYLTQRSGGGYTAGLLTAAGLMLFAAFLAVFLRRQPIHFYPDAQPGEETLDAAAVTPAQPEKV